jgi:hypothetical protein
MITLKFLIEMTIQKFQKKTKLTFFIQHLTIILFKI